MTGALHTDLITGVTTIDKTLSVVRILSRCTYFKTETTHLMYIVDLLQCVKLILIPKYHPEIAWRGVEYA